MGRERIVMQSGPEPNPENVNQNQTEQLVPQFTVPSRNNDSPTVLINEKLLLTLRHMCGILKLDSTTTHKSV